MKFLQDVFHLFYPRLCITCSASLLKSELIICTSCRHDLPVIPHADFSNNKIKNAFLGKIEIQKAASFLFYRKDGKTKTLIHHLKYKGNQEIGNFIGNWFGALLKDSNQFNDIDYIIPVPLHSKKLKKRGYNQLTTFGQSLEKQLNITYLPEVLLRTSTAKTQTFKQRFERFSNNKTKFSLANPTILDNKHILLIDDVITTGATLESCCSELLKAKNIKISIATIAYTE